MKYAREDITVTLVDISAQARELYGEERAAYIAGRPLPAQDLRFQVVAEREGHRSEITLPRHLRVSAEDLLEMVNRGRS